MAFVPYKVFVELNTGVRDYLSGGSWLDLSDRAMSVQTSRGRSRLIDTCQPGEMTVVLEDSDGFMSIHRHDPASGFGATRVRANRPIRIRVQGVSGGPIYPLFYGYVDSMRTFPDSGRAPRTVIRATDRFKLLARQRIAGSRPAEVATVRVAEVMNASGLVAGEWLSSTAVTSFAMSAFAYPLQPVLSILQAAASDDGGLLFVDPAGVLTYQGSGHRQQATRSLNVQFTLTSVESVAGAWIEPGLSMAVDEAQQANFIRVTDSAGTEWTDSDASYIADDGLLEFDLGPTLLTSAAAPNRAAVLLNLLKKPRTIFDTITVDPLTDTAAAAQALFLELSDRVRVAQGGLNATDLTTYELVSDLHAYVEQISHRLTFGDGGEWTWATSLALSRVPS